MINFRICFIIRFSLNQLMLWRSGMFLTYCTGEAGFEKKVRVDEYKSILFSFGKIGSFKGK